MRDLITFSAQYNGIWHGEFPLYVSDVIFSNKENGMYNINISKADNGFIVKVGCKTLVFEQQPTMISELSRFLSDPHAVEKEYRQKYGWDMDLQNPDCECDGPPVTALRDTVGGCRG